MDTYVHIWISLRMSLLSWTDCTRWWIYVCTRMNTYEHIGTHKYTHEWVYGWVCSHGQISWGDEYKCAHIWTHMSTNGHICTHMNESMDDLAVAVTLEFHEVINVYVYTRKHMCRHLNVDILTYVRTHMHTHANARVNTYEHICTHICTHIYTCMHSYVHQIWARVYTQMNTCVHTNERVRTYINESTDEFPVTVEFCKLILVRYTVHTHTHPHTHAH